MGKEIVAEAADAAEIAPRSENEEFEFGPVKSAQTSAKKAMWVASIVAWFGVIMTNIGNICDWYPRESGGWPGLYGKSAHGWAGALQRFIEGISYFTMISNIMVAVVFMLIALNPKKTKWRVALVDTTMMMITVTSIVFLTAILPFLHLRGLALVTSPWQHIITPVTAWVVWGLWGPRDFFGGYKIVPSLARTMLIPALWAVWMLVYGAFTHMYPYGFVNVNELGYGGVTISLIVVMAFGIVIELLCAWIDHALKRHKK